MGNWGKGVIQDSFFSGAIIKKYLRGKINMYCECNIMCIYILALLKLGPYMISRNYSHLTDFRSAA